MPWADWWKGYKWRGCLELKSYSSWDFPNKLHLGWGSQFCLYYRRLLELFVSLKHNSHFNNLMLKVSRKYLEKNRRVSSWGLAYIRYCMLCYWFVTFYSIIVGIFVEHFGRTAILQAKYSVGKYKLTSCWGKKARTCIIYSLLFPAKLYLAATLKTA